jgi:hypothetical protein
MSYTGIAQDGVIKLPPNIEWPDGTTVRVEKVERPQGRNQLTRRVRETASQLDGLPVDCTEQHAHYVHGTAKRPLP